MKRAVQLLILALLATPAWADVYMKTNMSGTTPDGKENKQVAMTFEGHMKNDRAVITITESGNAMYPAGKIFVDGSEMTLYNEKDNTCMPWDMKAMLQFAGSMLNAFGNMIQLEFGEPRIEMLEQRKAASMFGLAIDYYKYRSDWAMSFNAPLMKKRTYENSSLNEVWVAKELLDDLPAFEVFMDPDSFSTGHEELDEAIRASMPPIEGAMIKSRAVQTQVNQKGKEQISTTTQEVVVLDRAAGSPDGGYDPPADCEWVAAPMPPGAGPAPEGGDGAEDQKKGRKLPKVKIGNPFKKKKDKDGG